jgi:hypothetical protein
MRLNYLLPDTKWIRSKGALPLPFLLIFRHPRYPDDSTQDSDFRDRRRFHLERPLFCLSIEVADEQREANILLLSFGIFRSSNFGFAASIQARHPLATKTHK